MMSTAASTQPRELPAHIASVVDDAYNMGWSVVVSNTSVKVTPAAGSRVKPFSVSLNPPPVKPQLHQALVKNGFTAALAAWERDNPKEEAKVENNTQELEGSTDGDHSCPECAEAGKPRSFSRAAARGIHRRTAHGIVGTSAQALNAAKHRAAKKAPKETAVKKAAAQKAPTKKTAAKKVTVPAQAPAPAVETAPAVTGMPGAVTDAMGALVHAVGKELGDVVELRDENKKLTEFRDQVAELARDGSKAPVQVVSGILDLVEATEASKK
jgi:hypothetical protein